MKIYKLNKNRVSCSFLNYFIKIVITRNKQNIRKPLSNSSDDVFDIRNIVCSPRTLLSTHFLCFCIEISRNVKNAKPVSTQNQEGVFHSKMENTLSSASRDYSIISWKEILDPKIIESIHNNKKVFHYIDDALNNMKYPKTGMHGDFNPNNVIVDKDNKFWVVDWENYTPNGSVIWDLHWFYGVWERNTPKPPDDIISIFNNSTKANAEIKEILLIYSLMKLRLDLLRHKKSNKDSLDNFYLRILTIIEIG